MDLLPQRLRGLDLPLPLEPLLAGALNETEESARCERLHRAWHLTAQIATTIAWASSDRAGRRPALPANGLREPSAASWVQSLRHALDAAPSGAGAYSDDIARTEFVVVLERLCGHVLSNALDVLEATSHVPPGAMSSDQLFDGLIEFLSLASLTAKGTLLVVDRMRQSETGWLVESTRMHGASPQIDDRFVAMRDADGIHEGHAYWVSPNDRFVPLFPFVAAEVNSFTVRLGWFSHLSDETVARYSTHLSGDLLVPLTPDALSLIADSEALLLAVPPAASFRPDGHSRPNSRIKATLRWSALLALGATAAAGWGFAWLYARRAEWSQRDVRSASERARAERAMRMRAEQQLQATVAQAHVDSTQNHGQGMAVGGGVPDPQIAEHRARTLILATQAGHEGEALAAAIRVTGQALTSGLPAQEQAIDALASAIVALKHSFTVHARHDGRWASEVSPDGRRVAVADDEGRVRVWDTLRRHVVASLGHDALDVASAKFSPDGAHLVTWNTDGRATLWDAHSGHRTAEFDSSIRSLEFDSTGDRLLAAGEDGAVRVFATRNGDQTVVLQGHDGAVRSARWSADDSRVVSIGEDDTVRVWASDSGAPIQRLEPHGPSVARAEFSPDGTRIVTLTSAQIEGVRDGDALLGAHAPSRVDPESVIAPAGHVQLWSLGDGRSLLDVEEVPSAHFAQFSHDGARVVLSGLSGVSLWNTSDGTRVGVLGTTSAQNAAVVFSPDGALVSVTDANGTRVYRSATGAEFQHMDFRAGDQGTIAMFSPDGAWLFGAGTEQGDGIYSLETGERESLLRGNTGGVVRATFQQAGNRLLTVGRDFTVRIWDTDGGDLVDALPGHSAPVSDARFASDGSHAVSAGLDGVVRLWDENPSQSLMAFHHSVVEFGPDGHHALIGGSGAPHLIELPSGRSSTVFVGGPSALRAARFSPDHNTVTLVDHRGAVSVWDARTGQMTGSVASGSDRGEPRVAISLDARRVLLATSDGQVTLWNTVNGVMVAQYQGELFQANGLVLGSDGSRVLVQGPDGRVELRDAESGRTLARLSDNEHTVEDMVFSPDGSVVATASLDGPVMLWDGRSGQSLGSIEEFGSGLRFSPDGARLAVGVDGEGRGAAAGTTRGIVRVWDVRTRRILAMLDGHPGAITGIAFSADGTRIATTSDDRSARLWDASTGLLLASLVGHSEEVTSAGFSLDGDWVKTSGGDGYTRIFPATAPGMLAMACALIRPEPEGASVHRFCDGRRDHDHDHDHDHGEEHSRSRD